MSKFDDHGVVVKGVLIDAPVPARNQILVIRANETEWAGLLIDEVNFEDPETMPRVIEELDEILGRPLG